MLVSRNN